MAWLIAGGITVNALELDNPHWHVYGRAITLKGTITEESGYTTTEANKIKKYYLLELDRPINVRSKAKAGIDTEAEAGVSEIQLKINWSGSKTLLPKGNITNILERKVSVRTMKLEHLLDAYLVRTY